MSDFDQRLIDEAMKQYQSSGLPTDDPMAQAVQAEIEHQKLPSGSEMAQAFKQTELSESEVFRCTNLTKAYGSGSAYTEVIKGVSFSVQKSEYVVITGPSGSGKSTLLHLLAGLEVPTRGEIRLRDQVIQEFTDDDLARYHREEVGLVFQNFNLIDSLLVWENVAFPLMLSGAPRDWREHEAVKLLDRFGMADFARHFPTQLSGGQQQRVAMARALVHDPEIILFDEPTGNLDSVSASAVINEIERLHKQELRTILVVTHSKAFLPYASRVFYIQDGSLLTTPNAHQLDQTG
jgi:putative ABC transport system ATP-binding protein